MSSQTPAFTVTIPADFWKPTGPDDDPKARLLCTGIINGHHHHVEAYQVKRDKEGVQTIANSYFEEEWQGICALNTTSPFCEQRIGRRSYVIVMQPYGD